MQSSEKDRGQLEVNYHSIFSILYERYTNLYDANNAKTEICYRDTSLCLHKKETVEGTALCQVQTDAVGSYNDPKQSHVQYPEYAQYTQRIISFSGWQSRFAHQSREHMAKEGFFFLGTLDRVRCFYCGITLRDWEQDDYPYEAHLEWSENCGFIKGRRQQRIEERQQAVLLQGKSERSALTPGTSATTSRHPTALAQMASEQEAGACTSTPALQIRSSEIEAVLEMGYSLDLIERAIEIRRQSGGQEFLSAVELFKAVLELEKLDEDKK